MITYPTPVAAAVLALAFTIAPAVASAQTEVRPIVAGSVVVRRSPPNGYGNALAEGTVDRHGRFSIRARLEPGVDYDVSVACPPRTTCPQLTEVMVNGRTVRPVNDAPQRTRARGIGIYIIGAVVLGLRQPATVVITGQVASAPVAEPVDPRDPVRAAPRTAPGASAATRN